MHEELFVPSSDLADDSDSTESEHDWIDFEMVGFFIVFKYFIVFTVKNFMHEDR